MTTFNNHHSGNRLFKSTALTLFLALNGIPAWANNIIVNTLIDNTGFDGLCSLREAISIANTNPDFTTMECMNGSGLGEDIITFNVSGTVVLGSTLPIITDPAGLTIDGIGNSITLSGNNTVRVLQMSRDSKLTVKNLTVANGNSDSGSGIYNQYGTLSVINSTFTGNIAPVWAGLGGGIRNMGDFRTNTVNPGGTLTIVNSTFTNNTSAGGGAIFNGNGILNIINSTIVRNRSQTYPCPAGYVCATVMDAGGGITNTGTFTLDNSIVAGNIATGGVDIQGSVTTGSFNLIGDPSVMYNWNGIGPMVYLNGNNGNIGGINVTTVLDATLASNGGPTQTLALIPGSLAIDGASDALCANALVNNLDQRGVTRPQSVHCDIGAFEVAASADLAVSQTIAPNPVMVRDIGALTITVINNGAANATGVKVIDTLPAGLSTVSATASQGTCGAVVSGKITCDLGSLAIGQSATVTVKGIATITGTLTNQVSVSGDQADNQLANNSASQAVTVQALLCKGLRPTIVGTPGNDIIRATRNNDVIHALSGDDIISGGDGKDIICGGEGQDTLNGDGGNDTLDGGNGTDSCDGGSGTDTAANCEALTRVP